MQSDILRTDTLTGSQATKEASAEPRAKTSFMDCFSSAWQGQVVTLSQRCVTSARQRGF